MPFSMLMVKSRQGQNRTGTSMVDASIAHAIAGGYEPAENLAKENAHLRKQAYNFSRTQR
jgi:hypothetical protein